MKKEKTYRKKVQDFKNIPIKKQRDNYTRHYSFGFITGHYN